MTTHHEPEIFVICLNAFDDYKLHGQWIKANQPVDKLVEAVKHVLLTSPSEPSNRFAIYEAKGFGNCKLGEYESLKSVSEKAMSQIRHNVNNQKSTAPNNSKNKQCSDDREWEIEF